MHQGILHWTPSPHPNPIPSMRVATGALVEPFVWGKKGREGGGGDSARCWGPRLGPLGVWCLALLLCRDLVMRCDASSFPRETLARKNSRADGLAAQVGGRGGHGLLQLLLRAGNFPQAQVNPRSRPCWCAGATCTGHSRYVSAQRADQQSLVPNALAFFKNVLEIIRTGRGEASSRQSTMVRMWLVK